MKQMFRLKVSFADVEAAQGRRWCMHTHIHTQIDTHIHIRIHTKIHTNLLMTS